jgi:hypothetical protein
VLVVAMDIYAWPSPNMIGTPVDNKARIIASLQNERQGYLNRGLHERVALVDEVLASYGVRELATVQPDVEVATATKGKKRKSRE